MSFLLLLSGTVYAQRRNAAYNAYIERYAPLAVEQMKEHKIPASRCVWRRGCERVVQVEVYWLRKSDNRFGMRVLPSQRLRVVGVCCRER